MERLGWRFIRIRGSEYYRNPEQTMKTVLDSLLKHGINPSFEDIESDKQTNDVLLNVVKIKASAYRNEIVEQIEHNDIVETTESKPIMESNNQIEDVPDVHIVTSEYSEDAVWMTHCVLKMRMSEENGQ